MHVWKGWPLERLMYLFLGIAFTVVWAQIYLFHGVMAEFEAQAMVIPVYYTPLLALTAFLYAATQLPVVRTLFIALYIGGIITGAMGVYYHLHGVQEMGALSLQNLATGPPVLLPLTSPVPPELFRDPAPRYAASERPKVPDETGPPSLRN